MDTTTLIGLIASAGTGIALLPQLIKILREKKVQDISWLMMGSLFIGTACWTVYGFLIHDPIVIVANAFSFVVNCFLSSLNVYYRK